MGLQQAMREGLAWVSSGIRIARSAPRQPKSQSHTGYRFAVAKPYSEREQFAASAPMHPDQHVSLQQIGCQTPKRPSAQVTLFVRKKYRCYTDAIPTFCRHAFGLLTIACAQLIRALSRWCSARLRPGPMPPYSRDPEAPTAAAPQWYLRECAPP